MLNQSNFYEYQNFAVEHVLEHEFCGLFMTMGLGKTSVTLTAIDQLIYDRFEISKVLVIAPKRVAEDTWISEKDKWDHLKHLRMSLVLGTERQRKEALLKKADIYVINRENVAWLIGHYGTGFPFDMVVIDELSSFKNASSIRFKSLRQIRPKIKRVVGLTGTPTPNNLLDLWPQLYLLDQGERLGKTLTGYREKYFNPGKRNGHIIYEYSLKKEGNCQQEIYSKIGDICISMKTKDYLQLPPRIDRVVPVMLHGNKMQQYQEFEKSQILALAEIDDEISVVNAAALTNKLLQFANGAVYDDERNYHEVHDDKIEALEEILEAANGKPILVFYSYRHDVERIKKHLKKFHPQELEGSDHIKRWNKGEVPFMLAHPASAGHGLNMQAGGNVVVWFGLPWSLELYQQANARLDRQGQTESVIIHHLITKGTMDEDVMRSLANKSAGQEALMNAVKARIKKYLQKAA